MKGLQVSQKSEWRKILQSAASSHVPYAKCIYATYVYHICIYARLVGSISKEVNNVLYAFLLASLDQLLDLLASQISS